MKEKILSILKQSATLPFLFVGSGLSRRYLELEDWENLLRKFAIQAKSEEFAYELYVQNAEVLGHKEGILPKVAELVENDYNQKWFSSEKYSVSRERHLDEIKRRVSPFKIEIGEYLIQKSNQLNEKYIDEIELFKQIGNKSVAGFITTNYDVLLEKMFPTFSKYIGQEELIFSQILGISEIYKIHGCATKPESIIINEKDYLDFSERKAYLAAKLLTIFLEHPIVFLGYSISDKNIENILRSIVKCLSQEQLEKLRERMIFVEWCKPDMEGISTYSKAFEGDKSIDMTRIQLNDFSVLYEVLLANKAKYNSSMLRRLKEDIYELVLTNKPTGRVRAIGLEEDDKLDQVEVVVGVGVLSEFGQRGYLGVTANEIYQDLVLDDGEFDSSRIVCDSLPILLPMNSNMLPMYKYLAEYEGVVPEKVRLGMRQSFDELLSNTIRRYRDSRPERERTISYLTSEYSTEKCLQLVPNLKPENIDVDELRRLLEKVLKEFPNLMGKENQGLKSNFKRVVRIYDWLKYKEQ